MKRWLPNILLISACTTTIPLDPVVDTDGCAVSFVPDAGVRIDNASNGRSSISPEGVVTLYYSDNLRHQIRVATSSDGLAFTAGIVPIAGNFANSRDRILLADGSWRLFQLAPNYQFTMLQSQDGNNFTNMTVAYTPSPEDLGTMGVYDVYRDKIGTGITMLYIGDLFGANNARRAVSVDGGRTFTYASRNVLHDDGAGGGGRSFVDISSLVLPDGRRCLFSMRGGEAIYSFASVDWITYAQIAGARVTRGDWKSFYVAALFDPTVIRLPDGRYRMYVTAQLSGRQALVSATTR